ncbi:hypothetical protein HNR23_002262 [Nocardiopsis mwathae]|uniref:Uncharacterized protein n=1 Tax=Nocardiopsis mwathae TaxID=1472723 RepID=A0A7X0D5B1_9ACTN|nr:hypothetical protein [Nocardiopsis mwathae]MBB6172202.1 hypothetical protein [Nocardiopsis mwathae]
MNNHTTPAEQLTATLRDLRADPTIAYTDWNGHAMCLTCMPHHEAQRLADANQELGEIYPWNIDPGTRVDCDKCGALIHEEPEGE